jgi:glyoxylase-like metal-dependent hydrolase (beta-lactamase superfamily II)
MALAPGVDLFPAGWNATIIQQSDGIVILECPISGVYTQGIFDEAKRLYPGAPIKAVLSTSDSWPHVGGIRQSVADGLTTYILDLNQPLLERFINEPRTLKPDALSQSPKKPNWKIVSGKTVVGTGNNRVELYPLRGASTERQYMVYFPEHRVLYASDTLVINGDGSLYDPELTYEVVQAVKREGLDVTTVFAMHQTPVPWIQVLSLVEKAKQPAP